VLVDDTTKLATAEEEMVDIGVKAEEDKTGRASNPDFPFDLPPFICDMDESCSFTLLITSASSNSSKGLTGNR
jgi:hypothetical protein